MQNVIAIRKVAEPYGWLGNMSPHPVSYQNRTYRTAESLFQCLRFDDLEIQEEISSQASPMAAKMKAKKHRERMLIQPQSDHDVANMRLVIGLKAEQHTQLKHRLTCSNGIFIVEDCSKRPSKSGLFWGAQLVDEKWHGKNMLGKLWMELRQQISPSFGRAA